MADCSPVWASVEVTTDKAPVFPPVVDDAVPKAQHVSEQYANNAIEADHGLKARLRPNYDDSDPQHPFMQNLGRSHSDIATEHHPRDWLQAAFTELAAPLR